MSLYLDHFGLREPPFRITPHTDFFFTGANRGPTLEALIYAVTQDEGIVKVTGEVGSGKTMLCRMLLERLPGDVEALYLANPSLSRDEILGAIADEMGIPATGKPVHSMIRALQDALVERYAAGKRVVLLIDEAHAMPAESLEELRLLSNLESRCAKLLQIALFAQPELDERLAANDMRQLRERITQHFSLAPLKQDDVPAYLEFRLRTAGYRGPPPFTSRAVDMIARHSEGLSRRINILADKALLAAFSGGTHQVDVPQVKTAVHDARFAPLPGKRKGPSWLLPATGILTLVIAGGALGLALHLWPVSQPDAVAVTPSAPAPQAPLPSPHPATSPETSAPSRALVAVAPTAPSPRAAGQASAAKLGPLTRQYLEGFDTWLSSTRKGKYFLQLLGTEASSTTEIEGFLARASKLLEPAQLRVYRSSLSGQDRIGVIYGEFESREAALAALKTLPEPIRASQPFPRQVAKLQ